MLLEMDEYALNVMKRQWKKGGKMQSIKSLIMFGVAAISFTAYRLVKFLKKLNSPKPKRCDRCGVEIPRGMCVYYGKESICLRCWRKSRRR